VKIYGQATNGKMTLSPMQAMRKTDYLRGLKDGTLLVVEIKRWQKPKSSKQLGAWWGLFARIVTAELENMGEDTSIIFNLPEPTGVPVSKGLLAEAMYVFCPIFDEDGNHIRMSKMDTKQMAEFFTACCNFVAGQWKVYVPPPDKNWKLTLKGGE
jgi:hypothetical protein